MHPQALFIKKPAKVLKPCRFFAFSSDFNLLHTNKHIDVLPSEAKAIARYSIHKFFI